MLPRDKTKSKRWLGAITWTDLLEEFERLRFTDPARCERWRALLRHYHDTGAFGSGPGDSHEPFRILNSVAFRSLRAIDRKLREQGGSARALPWDPASEAVVHKTGNGASMRLALKVAPRARARKFDVSLRRQEDIESPLIVIAKVTRTQRRELASATADETAEAICEQLGTLLSELGRTAK